MPVNKVPETLVLPYEVTKDRMQLQQPVQILVNFRVRVCSQGLTFLAETQSVL